MLKVISRSTFDLQTVLDTLVESATRLCEADHSWLFLREGDSFRWIAGYGHATDVQERLRKYFEPLEVPIDRGSITGRAALEAKVVHVPDLLADPAYTWGEAQKIGGYRAALGVPLLREGSVIGVIFVGKVVAQAFTATQIDLVTNFADQAVIAIENVRLFEEVQARTAELQESLEYQTATSEVLNVISRSPSEIKPVLETITETAGRLCDAYDVLIRLREGHLLKVAAHRGPIAVDSEPMAMGRGWAMGRAAVDRKPVHVHDLWAAAHEFPDGHALARRLGARTLLATPLMRENEAIGAIAVRRAEMRPFSDKQVALLQIFADQAVIAIENVRLFEEVQARTCELQASLEQQTATSEILSIISASPGRLEPVFDAILKSARELCAAEFGHLLLFKGGGVASGGAPQCARALCSLLGRGAGNRRS